MPAGAIDVEPGLHVHLVGVRIDLGEDRSAEARSIEDARRLRGDRQRGQRLVGDEERLPDAHGLAVVGKLLDPAGAELDRGGVGPVGGRHAHFVTFLRW